MKKNIIWVLVSCLMVLSLIMASCGPAEEEEGEGEAVGPDVPKYGGTMVMLTGGDITTWNVASSNCGWPAQDGTVLEQILGIDRTKGPAGTGETTYVPGITDYRYLAGGLAESFETPEVGVWVLNIRQGVHWAYHPDQAASRLVNGREMTAEDVAYSLEFMRDTPLTVTNCNEPGLIQAMTVERTGEWQITVRTPVAPTTGYLWLMGGGGAQYVWPKEFLDTYATSNEWYDTVGTGPFMIDDYVLSSAAKYIRNPNYWDTNPVGPGMGDQLPYIDSINLQIIPDYSTRLAAFRTGRADWSLIDQLSAEDLETITGSNPEIEYVQTISAPMQVSGRVDLPGPYSIKDVRQAMMLAIDHPTILRDLHDGKAELLDSPARKWFPTIYTPLEELPEATQELYGYNPAKARQLLTDAGYPDGFKIKMVMMNNPASEEASAIIKEYWADVGIDCELQVLEPSIFIGLWVGHQGEDLMLNAWAGGDGALFVRYSMGYYRGPNIFNMSHVNDPPGTDPVIEAAYENQCKYVMVDYPSADAVTKEAYQYVLGEAFNISMPAPWTYRIWQPWIKNYYGEGATKFWLKYAWIDQDLKTELGR